MTFEFWGKAPGFPRHGGHGRRRFKRGMLKWVVLKLLAEGERHGYDFMRFFRERGWDAAPGPGSIYPILAALEEDGLVQGRDEDGKRIYTITDKGRAYLEEQGPRFDFKDFDDESDAVTNSDLREAFKRLAMAYAQIEKTAAVETAHKAVEILNAARKEIYTLLANE